MSSFINKIKSKFSRKNGGTQDKSQPTPTQPSSTDEQAKAKAEPSEQQYSIQPHPAKTNDPADLQRQEGLRSVDPMAAHRAREPYVPSPELQKNIEEPKSREELRARSEELNK